MSGLNTDKVLNDLSLSAAAARARAASPRQGPMGGPGDRVRREEVWVTGLDPSPMGGRGDRVRWDLWVKG